MIRISQLKMPLGHTGNDLLLKAAKELHIQPELIKETKLVKQSVDARKKSEIHYSYIVDIALKNGGKKEEERLVKKRKDRNITVHEEKTYVLPECGNTPLKYPPVVIGMGPAGLFCGLALARKGYRPILLERGEDVDTRTERVAKFWKTGELNPSSNVQFGERRRRYVFRRKAEYPCKRYLWQEQGSAAHSYRVWRRSVYLLCKQTSYWDRCVKPYCKIYPSRD